MVQHPTRVKLHLPPLHAKLFRKGRKHPQPFSIPQGTIRPRPRRSKHLGPNLPELPVSSTLRSLPPKLRSNVEQLLEHAAISQFVLDISSHNPSGILRPQRQALRAIAISPRPIVPRVHLLGYNVRLLAHAAREQRRVLKDRRADLAKPVLCKHRPRRGFDTVPKDGLRRKQIPRAAYCLQNAHYHQCSENSAGFRSRKHPSSKWLCSPGSSGRT